jgi:hypothetical protein
MIFSAEVNDGLTPQAPQEFSLFFNASTAVVKTLAQRGVLDRIPSNAHAKTKATPAKNVNLRGLFGDQGCLALREDQNSGCELELTYCGQESEQDERLVKGVSDVVVAGPPGVGRGICPNDVIVSRNMGETKTLHGLRVIADGDAIGPNVQLRENSAYPHLARDPFNVVTPLLTQ